MRVGSTERIQATDTHTHKNKRFSIRKQERGTRELFQGYSKCYLSHLHEQKKKYGNTTLLPHQFCSQNYWAYIHSARRQTPVSSLKTSAKNRAACLSTRNPDSQHRHSKNVPQSLQVNHHSWRGCVFGDDEFMKWPPQSGSTYKTRIVVLYLRAKQRSGTSSRVLWRYQITDTRMMHRKTVRNELSSSEEHQPGLCLQRLRNPPNGLSW